MRISKIRQDTPTHTYIYIIFKLYALFFLKTKCLKGRINRQKILFFINSIEGISYASPTHVHGQSSHKYHIIFLKPSITFSNRKFRLAVRSLESIMAIRASVYRQIRKAHIRSLDLALTGRFPRRIGR